MAITYTLSVDSVNTANLTELLKNGISTPVNCPDTVYSVNYTYSGTDGKNTASVNGTISVGNPDPAKFLPIQNVTTGQALQWALTSFAPDDLKCFQNAIEAQLEAKKAPIVKLNVVLAS
jgi:hypothetical protein